MHVTGIRVERKAPTEPNWQRIENFVGFGRRDAPVVFIGMEEGLRRADGLDADLATRSTYETPVMDLEEAHRGVAGTEHYFEPNRAPRQPTWRVMADLMLRRLGYINPTAAERRKYQALDLGRSHGESLLTELLPYPHPKTSDWLYDRFGRFTTREAYENVVLPKRKHLLRTVLAESSRELIVCYGRSHWMNFQALFDVKWTADGKFCIAEAGGTRIVLARHFSGHDFNTNSQLAELARVALPAR